jgi:hypothetical protein
MLRVTCCKDKTDTFSDCKVLPVVFLQGLVEKNANTDRPPIGFCIEPPLGSKYDACLSMQLGLAL